MATVRTVLSFHGNDSVVDLDKKYEHWLAKEISLEAWGFVSADQKLSGIISRVFDTRDKQSGYGLLLSGALQFDGKDDFIEIKSGTDALGFPGKANTIEAWVKPVALGRAMGLVNKANYPQPGSYHCGILADGRLRQLHGVPACELASSRALRTGEDQHVAVTYDGRVVRLFIDGEPGGSAEAAYTSEAATSLWSGSGRGSGQPLEHFAGVLDEVRIWERARSEDELRRDNGYRLVGNEPGLLAYYRFDEGEGQRLYDQTDSALHAEIHGEARWVTSDAPIGDRLALRRDSFHLRGRSVEKGLSAMRYFQQEDATIGYGGEPKPMKRQARVMLACATSSPVPDGAATDRQHIAVIDLRCADQFRRYSFLLLRFR